MCEIVFAKRENGITQRQYKMEASIPSPSLWCLGTLSEQLEEKLEESQETTRDVAIAVTMHSEPA